MDNAFEEDFERYVSRYCKMYGYSREEALQHQMVKDVKEYYIALHEEKKELSNGNDA